jgi:hypothetical protein
MLKWGFQLLCELQNRTTGGVIASEKRELNDTVRLPRYPKMLRASVCFALRARHSCRIAANAASVDGRFRMKEIEGGRHSAAS